MTDQQQQQQQEDNTILQENNTPATIATDAQQASAGAEFNSSEDTQSALTAVINQQNDTIAALLERTNSLTAQINELIRNGAVITDNQSTTTAPEPQTNSLADDYIPLKDLGAQIGKRD